MQPLEQRSHCKMQMPKFGQAICWPNMHCINLIQSWSICLPIFVAFGFIIRGSVKGLLVLLLHVVFGFKVSGSVKGLRLLCLHVAFIWSVYVSSVLGYFHLDCISGVILNLGMIFLVIPGNVLDCDSYTHSWWVIYCYVWFYLCLSLWNSWCFRLY